MTRILVGGGRHKLPDGNEMEASWVQDDHNTYIDIRVYKEGKRKKNMCTVLFGLDEGENLTWKRRDEKIAMLSLEIPND